jgi:hypothetical protein
MNKHTPSLLKDALIHDNVGFESLVLGVHKSGEYGSAKPNSYIIALWQGLLAEYFPLRGSYTITRSEWATDNQDRGYTVLDVWFHSKPNYERHRQCILTVHLYEDFEFEKDGNKDFDKEPIRRYCDTAIAGCNGLDPFNPIYFIKTWGLQAKIGRYTANTGRSKIETSNVDYSFEGKGEMDEILTWLRVNGTPVDRTLD